MSDNLVDKVVFKGFVTPSVFNVENFQELAGNAVVEAMPAGKTVFKPGDTDCKTVHLIEDEIELILGAGAESRLKSNTDMSKHPIAHQQSHKHLVVAKVDPKITRIDNDLLDILLSSIEVDEIIAAEDEDDGMTRTLQPKTFLKNERDLHISFLQSGLQGCSI